MNGQQCSSCRFWKDAFPVDGGNYRSTEQISGWCHRYPPHGTSNLMIVNGWCGEWQGIPLVQATEEARKNKRKQ
jgi:hypothetical protein